MKASLQLRLGQQLTMTPQLQQAIRLLQLSTLELQQEIQEALESNPLLEVDESQNSSNAESTEGSVTTDDSEMGADVAMEQQNISEELAVDASWDDHYSAGIGTGGAGYDGEDSVYQGETSDNLQDHLFWQMEMAPLPPADRAIAHAIIEGVDEAGFLTVSLEDIQQAVKHDGFDVDVDEVAAILKYVQHFDPIGVAARDLQECLLIQLAQFDPQTPWLSEARELLNEHLELLSKRDYRTLMRKTKLSEEALREVMRLIQSLNPRPGAMVSTEEPDYVIPDITVRKRAGRWVAELNNDSMPRLAINQQYAAMSRQARNSADSTFIRNHLQEAKWFIKSLESRNDTLLKVANNIVEYQQDFFEIGPQAMKPMVLNDVATAVEMHESTISRVTTHKYMHTPRGVFELKYFFSSHVATDDGGECSSTAIRALIKQLVGDEKPNKPLSDAKIADLLAEQGIQVARRTIAKYRESLSIPPSNQRKRLL